MDWRKRFYEAKTHQIYMFGGQRGGNCYVIAAYAKAFPKHRVIVRDLQSMDRMIKLGVQPSQIIMTSEFRNSSRIITMSIDGEDIKDGGNQ